MALMGHFLKKRESGESRLDMLCIEPVSDSALPQKEPGRNRHSRALTTPEPWAASPCRPGTAPD